MVSFIRGWDNGRGVDVRRPNLSAQDDATAANGLTATDAGHAHTYNMATARTVSDGGVNGAFTQSTSTNTGYASITVKVFLTRNQTRNISMMYIIKAIVCYNRSSHFGGYVYRILKSQLPLLRAS